MSRETIAERVAKFVKEKREAKGETQEQLAIRAFGDKKKQSWINKIEKGRPVGLFTLEKLLIALDSDIDFIED